MAVSRSHLLCIVPDLCMNRLSAGLAGLCCGFSRQHASSGYRVERRALYVSCLISTTRCGGGQSVDRVVAWDEHGL